MILCYSSTRKQQPLTDYLVASEGEVGMTVSLPRSDGITERPVNSASAPWLKVVETIRKFIISHNRNSKGRPVLRTGWWGCSRMLWKTFCPWLCSENLSLWWFQKLHSDTTVMGGGEGRSFGAFQNWDAFLQSASETFPISLGGIGSCDYPWTNHWWGRWDYL